MLVRKEQKWKWEKEQEEVFGKLKAVFTTEPVLAFPDIDKEMRVEVDASDYAIGGVCYDLAKQLSYYLYFFSFILDLLHRRKCRKVSYHKCHTVTVT